MVLYFITGNKNKFEEVKSILNLSDDEFKQLDIDLPEVQEINAHKIITEKLSEAFKHKKGEFIVEDTSLYMGCLNNQLPGPLIKWFMKAIGNEGIYELAKKYNNFDAEAKTIFGYGASNKNKNEKIFFFEGILKGTIVKPEHPTNFGWDPLFKPLDHTKSFAEMSRHEKNQISMRKIALDKLKHFLEKKD